MSSPKIVVIGGGIAGLVLALCLKKHCGLEVVVYEQAAAFGDGVGGAIGLYPNGLRVIRDIDDGKLLSKLRSLGYDYIYRRWYRHNGTQVAIADETILVDNPNEIKELQSMGIRRYKLQNSLYEAVIDAGITVKFGFAVSSLMTNNNTEKVEISFRDGSSVTADYVFGADGVKSKARDAVIPPPTHLEYTGVTCLMGSAPIPRAERGICFPSSTTTRCHMCTYPTSDNETIFQIYFPTPTENSESWGTMSPEESQKECNELADKLDRDGWANQFVEPIRKADPNSLVRVGLRSREALSQWVSNDGRIVLLGDAAHPPVPYIGQGAMMAIEDAGTIALLLKHTIGEEQKFSHEKFLKAMKAYEETRIQRTYTVLGSSHKLGKTQQNRADSWVYNIFREWSIKLQVLLHGTLPIMKPGATYDYKSGVEQTIVSSGI